MTQSTFSLEARHILAEQIRAVYRQTATAVLGTVAVGSVAMVALWDVVPHWKLGIWYGVLLVMMTVRAAAALYFWKRRERLAYTARWRYLAIAFSALAGGLWGIGGFFLFPEHSLPHQLLLIMMTLAMSAGAVAVFSVYLPAVYAYFLPASLILIRLAEQGSGITSALALTGVFYVVTMLTFSSRLYRIFEESQRLRFQVTEQKAVVEQVTEQKAVVEQASIAKSKFLAAASHDLRQPLHALDLFLDALERRVSDRESHELVEVMRESSAAMQEMIVSLMDISKLDTQPITPAWIDFPLQPLLNKLRNDFMLQAHRKGLRLSVRGSHHRVRSDPVMLERILCNLISNAIRYTDVGGVVVGVRLRNGQSRIEVWDSGIGIAPDQLSAIFREFYRVESHDGREKGQGLGLAIVERMAQLLGHRVQVASRLGKGSMFAIELTTTPLTVP
ncbi:MAG: HAMP domain-containing sensor histidine kinase [Pseudomonadota bacterium]